MIVVPALPKCVYVRGGQTADCGITPMASGGNQAVDVPTNTGPVYGSTLSSGQGGGGGGAAVAAAAPTEGTAIFPITPPIDDAWVGDPFYCHYPTKTVCILPHFLHLTIILALNTCTSYTSPCLLLHSPSFFLLDCSNWW